MDTVVFTDQKAIDFFSSTMILAKINAEVDTLSKQKYKVSGYPTTVLINKAGEEVDRLVGYAEVDEYIETLVNYSKGIGTLDDLLNRAKDDENRELFAEIADKYKYRGGSAKAETWYGKVIAAGEPLDSMSGASRVSIADMYRRASEYDKSLAAFEAIAGEFAGTSFGMDADIYIAIVYKKMEKTDQAIEAFEKYVEKYPDSEDVSYAKGQIEKLKNPPEQEAEDEAEKEAEEEAEE